MMTWFTTRQQLNKKRDKRRLTSTSCPFTGTAAHQNLRSVCVCWKTGNRLLRVQCSSGTEKRKTLRTSFEKETPQTLQERLCEDSTVKGVRTKTRVPRVEVLPGLVLLNCEWNTAAANFQLDKRNEERFYKSIKLVYLRLFHDNVFSHCYQEIFRIKLNPDVFCFPDFHAPKKVWWSPENSTVSLQR